VRTTAQLGTSQPVYSFDVSVGGEPVGVLAYPENLCGILPPTSP